MKRTDFGGGKLYRALFSATCFAALLTGCTAEDADNGQITLDSSSTDYSSSAVSSMAQSSDATDDLSNDITCEDRSDMGRLAYQEQGCAACHGQEGAGGPYGPIDPVLEAYRHSTMALSDSALALNDYIAKYMPLGGGCDQYCADSITAYLKNTVANESWCPESNDVAQSSSSNAAANEPPQPAQQAKAHASPLRRLSNAEYNNTVRDLLGISSLPADTFPVDSLSHGYANQGGKQNMTVEHAQSYYDAATELIQYALARNLPALDCDDSSRTCVERVLRDFALRAWRRPVLDVEVEQLLNLFDQAQAGGFNFSLSMTQALRALLLSPNFLYLPEDGNSTDAGSRHLTGYELATRLAYFLWASTPDQTLLALAGDGSLLDENVLSAQVQRMLTDEKSLSLVDDFARRWLQYDFFRSTPDALLFPQFNDAMKRSMVQETRAFVNHLMRDVNAPVSELLTADYSFIDGQLTALYQVSGDDGLPLVQPLIIEAENYSRAMDQTAENEAGVPGYADGVDVVEAIDQASGYAIGYTEPGEWLEYTINIPIAGEYQIAARVASVPGGGQFQIFMPENNTQVRFEVNATGGWQRWETLSRDLGYLQAGLTTIALEVEASGFNVNWLKLGPIVPDPVRIEAEDYIQASDSDADNLAGIEGYLAGVDVEETEDFGGGFNVGFTADGEWLEYGLSVPEDGLYTLNARVASGRDDGLQAGFAVLIDGERFESTFDVKHTGGWQNWETLSLNLGELSVGDKRLRLAITNGGFNINWLELTPTDPVAAGFERVDWQPGDNRKGILSHASIITTNSNNRDDHPVRRGLWILEKLTCDEPPPPNNAILDQIDQISGTIADVADKSTRQLLEEKTSNPACASCHKLINPVGFGWANYDAIGQWRTSEWRGPLENGPWTIDARGTLTSGESFDGPLEMAEVLADSYRVPMCTITHLMTYALGRHAQAFIPGGGYGKDYAFIYDIYQKTKESHHRFQDIIEQIILSDAFRSRVNADVGGE